MKVSSRSLLVISSSVLVFGVLLLGSAARCQTTAVLTVGGGGAANAGLRGHPYSAVRETETIQTLSDGTHITRKTRMQFYRDSLGRTRQEMSTIDSSGASSEPQNITILDPVEGVNYFLNPRTHTGTLIRVRPINPPNPPPKPPVPVNPPPRPPQPDAKLSSVTQQDDLGMQMMEGVWAKGTRFTTTIPANAQGNDRPLTTVSETWFSEELQATILAKRSDPRSGEMTERLTNIDRSEPDPSLLRPPADYTIIDQQHQ